MENQAEFTFACPHCGQHLEAESDMVGMKLECPSCGKPLVVPSAHSTAQSEAPKPRNSPSKEESPQEKRDYIGGAKSSLTGIRNAATPLIHRLMDKWTALDIPQRKRVVIIAATILCGFVLLTCFVKVTGSVHHAKKSARETMRNVNADMGNPASDLQSDIGAIEKERGKGQRMLTEQGKRHASTKELDKVENDENGTIHRVVPPEGAASVTYCVIDLSAGANASSYPVTYIPKAPEGTFSGGYGQDTYRTTKLVLKRIEAGSFIMGDDQTDEKHRVTLTKPFYIGLFEVTEKQFLLVMGGDDISSFYYTQPVEASYNSIRGASKGAKWPESNSVDSSSFLGKLRARTGLDFDLPTEAQWEYACRAGTTTKYSYGNDSDGKYMWYDANAIDKIRDVGRKRDVGKKRPNAWGLYDMHGNVYEWCLDWFMWWLPYGTDPQGFETSCKYPGERVRRGGAWFVPFKYCTSDHRHCLNPNEKKNTGFRLALTVNR